MRKISLADTIRARLDTIEFELSELYDFLETRHSLQKEYECRRLEEDRKALLNMLDRELELN